MHQGSPGQSLGAIKRALRCGMCFAQVVCLAGVAQTCVAGSKQALDKERFRTSACPPQSWCTGGRDQNDSYFSPLKLIDSRNVKRLGFAWQFDLGTRRGQEATPVVIKGVMYTSSERGYVYALNAATGKEIWRFAPQVNAQSMRNPCCDLVNRGVAVWAGRVYVASVDGRLHALDGVSGKELWSVDTIVDHSLPYSSTDAPQIAGDMVVIGNSGADMEHGAVRGYVSAYDSRTGAFRWRFFTVPPPPSQHIDGPALVAAQRSWGPHRPEQFYGGGTAWDGFAYDEKLRLVYFGTGNAAPYDLRQIGSAKLNLLYTASIIALHANTGRLAWYYQTTPNDHWDYDADAKLILETLKVGGLERRVLLQANKNGFFYVLDCATGELLSANPYTFVNWASGINIKTGRPIVTSQSDWYGSPKDVYPSWAGGHSWNPMSYSPRTHLVYIPVNDAPNVWVDLAHNGGQVKFIDGSFTADGIIPDDTYDAADLAPLVGSIPSINTLKIARTGKLVRELIRAWDPIAHKVVWQHETSSGSLGFDGGVMSTAGNLVFQGRGSGSLWAYAADTGRVLKIVPTGSHIMAAPMTYEVNGTQYIAVQVGFGGAGISAGGIPPSSAAAKFHNTGRILSLKLGGGAVPTPPARSYEPFDRPPPDVSTKADINAGKIKFLEECSRCHAFGPNVTPDLRRNVSGLPQFKAVVLHGALAPAGMEQFGDLLSKRDVEHIYEYLVDQAWVAYRAQETQSKSHD